MNNTFALIDAALIKDKYNRIVEGSELFGGTNLFEVDESLYENRIDEKHLNFLKTAVMTPRSAKFDLDTISKYLSDLTYLVYSEYRSEGFRLISNYLHLFEIWSNGQFTSQIKVLSSRLLERLDIESYKKKIRNDYWESFIVWIDSARIKRWIKVQPNRDAQDQNKMATIQGVVLHKYLFEKGASRTIYGGPGFSGAIEYVWDKNAVTRISLPSNISLQLEAFKKEAAALSSDLEAHAELINKTQSYCRIRGSLL